jgi:hypothetical protein
VHLVGDVLDRLIAEVVVGDRGLVTHLLVHGRRDADAPGLGQGLEAGGDVHAVAVEAIAIDGHVAHVRTDAKLHLALLGDVGVAGAQHALDLDRALDRADRGRELREEVVAREVGDAAPVLAHQRLDLLPVRRQRADRRLLIVRHQPAVACDVGAQDRGELAFHGASFLRMPATCKPSRARLASPAGHGPGKGADPLAPLLDIVWLQFNRSTQHAR